MHQGWQLPNVAGGASGGVLGRAVRGHCEFASLVAYALDGADAQVGLDGRHHQFCRRLSLGDAADGRGGERRTGYQPRGGGYEPRCSGYEPRGSQKQCGEACGQEGGICG